MNPEKFILVCNGAECRNPGAEEIYNNLRHECSIHNADDVQVIRTGCLGFCAHGPVVKTLPDETLYAGVTPEDAAEIVENHIINGKKVERLLYNKNESKQNVKVDNADFYQKQFRIVLRNCGIIDPENIEEYIARDGYAALEKVVFDMNPDDIITELKSAGLRGRGGAGFPTWMKWNFTKQVESDEKFVVCNADEGDPGAYMDRGTLEGDPHSILEAMTIAGYCIGAKKGYIYIRAEYPLAIERLQKGMEDSRALGLLGDNILGSDFSFDIEIRLGAGAFVCGEETALIASIEGERGMPKPRPPFPSVKGVWGKPTLINNVETWANIPVIITRGGEWFSKIGTEDSRGTKVFALTGKIRNSGLVEVPMGTTLREIVYDIGGGIPGDKAFKAVQTGGPSGGVIPAEYLDTPIDYIHLKELGSIMGSGGMIIMDEDDCMVDVAKFYLGFSVDESCGKCSPCRIGGRTLYNILEKITTGNGELEDIEKLKTIGKAMQTASLCGLGQTAPNPILSTLKYFEDEYLAHIKNHRCPSKKCKELISFHILADKCVGCTICAKNCPVNVIDGAVREVHTIDQSGCIKCGKCFEVCKFNAVFIK